MYIVSIIMYFLIISNCVTFRMKIRQYILLAGIITFFIILGSYTLGDILIIPMYVCVILFLWRLKKEDIFYNILLLIFSYVFLVIIDNLSDVIWQHFGWDLSVNFWPYVFINLPLYAVISRLLSISVKKIKRKKSLVLPDRIKAVLVIDMTLCMIIFVTQVMFERRVGGSPLILWGNIILYIAYFVLTFFMVYVFIKEYSRNAEIMLKQHSYEN